MTQIKSYLSLESVPSQQFRTPPAKATLHTMTTNNSLSFSNTIGSFDNRSGGNRKAMYRSNQLFKNISYQTRDHVSQQDQIDNQSAVTLSPAVTPIDYAEVINAVKMVAFMSRQCQERQILIDKKTKAIKEIQEKIYLLQEKIGFQKKQFVKREKNFKSKSLSINKYKKKASESLQNQMMQMKLQINKIKRSISSKKYIASTKPQMQNVKKGKSNQRSKKQKIYVPIPIPPYINESMYPQLPLTQRSSRKSDYLAFHLNQNNYAYPTHQNFQSAKDISVCYSHQNRQSDHEYATFGKRTISNDMNINSQKKASENEMSGKKILDIIQQKLQMDFNIPNGDTRHRNFMTIDPQHNPQIQNSAKNPLHILGLQSKDFRSNVDGNSNLNSQSIHINVLKQAQKQPNLDYFHDDEIHGSKKSAKNTRQTKGLTNTWKKDKEDQQIVQLLKKSISQQNQRQKQQKILKSPPQRSELGAKLIVTNICPEQSSFDMALPQKSRQRDQIVANSSQVDIFVDSQSKSNNSNSKSLQSKKKVSTKRQNIMNSSIGIVLHDMSDSQDDSPTRLQNKSRSPNKTSITKKISIISQALEESQPNTPVPEDIRPNNNFNLEPSIQSQYTQTVRQTNLKDAIEMMASNQNLPEKKSSDEIHTPPLSRPPSLLEQSDDVQQEYVDDMIDSIKLSASSKIIESPSKFNSNIKASNQGDDDFLGQIRLVAMSKISRQKSRWDHSQPKNESIFQEASIVDKMTFSEVTPTPATNGDSQEDISLMSSQLRQSSQSVIVKKGSAIHKSATRIQSPNLKSSNKGANSKGQIGSHLTGKSGDLSTPIQQQAEDEQQQLSSIVHKHRRNATDLN